MTNVDMWFDPKCPWAWIASRWLLEVERVRDVQVRFHVLSLAVLNQGRGVEPWYREWLDSAWGPARVATAVEQKFGAEEVLAVYTALGNRIHLEKQPLGRELYVAALTEAGLPAELANAADSTELDDVMLAGNRAGLEPVGEDLGTPAIRVTMPDGSVNAFFGPVVSPTPRGEAAGQLWDGVLLVAGTPGFFELKRARTSPLS
ncbi:DsbA family protein [Actinophytocola sp.]|uniref:DsbA family protein n=1 Tax=Actinophytocola sp. TaxID=1872138 RepID=UPI002ED64BAE